MTRTIQTTYRYRLDPTTEQEAQCRRFAGARRFVWNWALGRKRDRNNSYLMTIGRFYPSTKTCGSCSVQRDDLTLSDCEWTCACGVHHDRDLNAARTIDREGVRLFEQMVAAGYAETQNACGDVVSPIERLAQVDEPGSPRL